MHVNVQAMRAAPRRPSVWLAVAAVWVACGTAPVQPAAALDLSNWMGALMPVIANSTILDLSLPGTHDTLSVALDDVVGDDAEDIPLWVSDVLHLIKDFDDVGDFIRNQVRGRGAAPHIRGARGASPVRRPWWWSS
jgi:hypothetical protein